MDFPIHLVEHKRLSNKKAWFFNNHGCEPYILYYFFLIKFSKLKHIIKFTVYMCIQPEGIRLFGTTSFEIIFSLLLIHLIVSNQ